MQATGKVTNVYVEATGSTLSVAALDTDTSIEVEDAFDFEESGGTLEIEGTQYTYTAVDYDTDTLTLSAALGTAYEEDTQVLVVPSGTSKWAMVDFDDDEEGVRAFVPPPIDVMLEDGIRDINEQETVVVDDSDGRWTVQNVDGEAPLIKGSYVSSEGLPSPTPTEPPGSSPEITVTGTTASIVVEAENVPAGTRIQYHISMTDGFVPDSSTLYVTTESQVAVIPTLPDNSPLVPGADYYLVAIAENDIGEAPTPSAQVQGALDLDNVDEIVLARLVAGFILAGQITVGQITIDANVGITVNRPGGGYSLLIPADGVSPIEAVMQIVSDYINVDGNLYIGGNAQIRGEMQMSNGIENPQEEPGAGSRYVYQSVINNGQPGETDFSNFWAGATEWHNDTNAWAQCISYVGAIIRKYRKSDGLWQGDLSLGSWKSDFYPWGGMARIGNSYYLCGQDSARGGDWYIYQVNALTGAKSSEVYIASSTTYSNTYRPGMASNGVDKVYMVACGSANNTRVKSWNASLGAESGWSTLESFTSRKSVADCMVVTDGGTERLYVAYRNGPGEVSAFLTSSYAASSAYYFKKPDSVPIGMFYDSNEGERVVVGGDGSFYTMGKYVTDTTIKTKLSWLDDNATGGTHETMPGPEKVYVLPACKWLTGSVPTPPDLSNTDPSNTDKANKVALYLTADNWSTTYRVVFDGTEDWSESWQTLVGLSSGTPKVTNEFTTSTVATPGRFRSTKTDADGPLIDLYGSGAWRLAPFSSVRCFSRRYRTSNLALSGTTKIGWGGNAETTGITWDSTNDRWVVQRAGIYYVEATVNFTSTFSGVRVNLQVVLNVTNQRLISEINRIDNVNQTLSVSGFVSLAVGDTIQINTFTNGTPTLAGAADEANSQRMHAMIGLVGV